MIPVIDWSRYGAAPDVVAAEIGLAFRETGFATLVGHGVPEEVMAAAYDAADGFFALPAAEKARIAIDITNRGWAATGTERLDETSGEVDAKEAFNVGWDLPPNDPRIIGGEPFRAVNRWPDLQGFRDAALGYFDAAHRLGVSVQSAIARDLALPPDYFDGHFDAPMATLRFLKYPAGDGGIGAGAHSDYGSITLLSTDGEAGLQVLGKDGEWLDVPFQPGALIVNIGDCLMRWSNDLYVSTKHRVLRPKRVRRSIAFFLDPNPDSVISALPGTGAAKYPPISAAEYLRSRLDATYEVPA
ncbi:isopenicillin N synthase family dioxygenase [Aestuariibius sp. 2305UL40-4]|uniref:isopenicillin N synthase family dioxygenase n=1 Tax=Aestuariibius violaceus TaxID=3234132 RepID=UPI00345EC661